jgi:hypothetical protein
VQVQSVASRGDADPMQSVARDLKPTKMVARFVCAKVGGGKASEDRTGGRMGSTVSSITYFDRPGKENTEAVLKIARERAGQLGLRQVLVATTSGDTGRRAAELFTDHDLVVVTHSTGFSEPNVQALTEENRAAILAQGARLLTCQHAFGGVNRAVRRKLNTYQLDEIIAYTLRLFGEGVKVACEITLMAADAGLIRTDEPVLAIAGTGRGADTAVILRAANAQDFFDLRVNEILCKPLY